jgi:hypothetical protein
MAITLEQDVAYKEMPAGTDWVFTISSTNYAGNYKFKYIADLYIGIFGNTYEMRLKFSPNSTGNGIIDISKILEQYVSPDRLGSYDFSYKSEFKGIDASATLTHPLQLTDKFSVATNSIRRLTIKWGEEYSANATDAPTQYLNELTSSNYLFWNGVAYNNEEVNISDEYGIDLENWNNKDFITDNDTALFLTDAPSDKQYIGDKEYATLSFLNGYFPSHSKGSDAIACQTHFYDIDGTWISMSSYTLSGTTGGYPGYNDTALTWSTRQMQHVGVGTANMLGAGVTIPSNWYRYDVYLVGATAVSAGYSYYKKNADCKGFEKIRLTWLNKYGVWDYYTFTKKNIRSTNITRAEYSKIKGNWNASSFSKNGFDRGRGVLNTNATETISLNSDWMDTDDEAAWLEQLFISPEVYILGDFISSDTATYGAEYGKYLTPVVVTSKSYDRYTRANDKVAQYELDIEYSINKRTQRA